MCVKDDSHSYSLGRDLTKRGNLNIDRSNLESLVDAWRLHRGLVYVDINRITLWPFIRGLGTDNVKQKLESLKVC